MKIKKFSFFLNEEIDDQITTTSSYDDIKEDLKKLIEKSLKSSDSKTVESFISSYLKDDEKNQIEGLINDSDVYDFYLKYRNSIDEVLSKKEFFEKKPSEMDSFSLYDFVISGAKVAVRELLSSMTK
jgi:hypothetical protein